MYRWNGTTQHDSSRQELFLHPVQRYAVVSIRMKSTLVSKPTLQTRKSHDMGQGRNSCLLLSKPLDGWIRVSRVISARDVDVLDAHARAIPVGWDLEVSWWQDAVLGVAGWVFTVCLLWISWIWNLSPFTYSGSCVLFLGFFPWASKLVPMMFRYSTISLTVKLPDASELRSARSKRAVFGTSLSWLHITMHQVHQSFFIGPMLLGQNSENIRDEEITKHWAALARYKILGFAKVYLFCSVCIRLIIRRCW